MSSRPVSFRVDTESLPGQVLAEWEAKGYNAGEVCRLALLALGDHPIPHRDSMDEIALQELQKAVNKLEGIAATLATGGTLTPSQRQEAADAISPQTISAMRSLIRPGRRTREEGEK